MSIHVAYLTKMYGEQAAVNQISFQANKSEITGFLGSNGAGKTTTMKILTCFIPQSSGTAKVCGFDTREDSMEVRKRIGYLPENNPLYKDMYVKEYLWFIAGLHRLKSPKNLIHQMIERTGLTREKHKQIGSLSKGYRQRVGLAQAMLHNPDVLILDEPISGLDPNQLVEIRQLIRDLGKEKTLIFSSHIMQEVQALCDRVVIINKGRLVANDTIDNLQKQVSIESKIDVAFNKAVPIQKLEAIKTVLSVEKKGGNKYLIRAEADIDIRPDLFRFAAANDYILLELSKQKPSIEDIFQKLTK